jgi:hypothetical protein
MQEHSPGGNDVPSHASRLNGLSRTIESSVVESLEIPFELRNCAMLPIFGLRQERAPLDWPESRSLAVQ